MERERVIEIDYYEMNEIERSYENSSQIRITALLLAFA